MHKTRFYLRVVGDHSKIEGQIKGIFIYKNERSIYHHAETENCALMYVQQKI